MKGIGTFMAQPADGFDARDLLNGAGLLAATANVIMQLSRP